jgi:phospholipase/carboxylesterase
MRRHITLFLVAFLLCSCNPPNSKLESRAIKVEKHMIELVHGSGEPTHAIIWLHGLGATADDFPPIVPELGLNDTPAIKFIFPQAPNRPITINGGMVMPGWYDIKGFSLEEKQDREGMDASREMLEGLVKEQIDLGIASNNIILAGFSQGGAVTYYTGIRSEHKFAGLLPLSTYMPFHEEAKEVESGVNKSTPIFASHGTVDPIVPVQMGNDSATLLKGLGYNVEFKTYPMQHQVMMEQIQDIGAWINKVFAE